MMHDLSLTFPRGLPPVVRSGMPWYKVSALILSSLNYPIACRQQIDSHLFTYTPVSTADTKAPTPSTHGHHFGRCSPTATPVRNPVQRPRIRSSKLILLPFTIDKLLFTSKDPPTVSFISPPHGHPFTWSPDHTRTVLYLFDSCITFSQELLVIWKQKWSLMTWIYAFTRYGTVLLVIYDFLPSVNLAVRTVPCMHGGFRGRRDLHIH